MIKAISLFSGAGGMDVGFEKAGVEVVLANEKSMENFLGLFREKFDTAEKYLHTLGLSEQEIQILRDKMTV